MGLIIAVYSKVGSPLSVMAHGREIHSLGAGMRPLMGRAYAVLPTGYRSYIRLSFGIRIISASPGTGVPGGHSSSVSIQRSGALTICPRHAHIFYQLRCHVIGHAQLEFISLTPRITYWDWP